MSKVYETMFALGAKVDKSFGKSFTKVDKQFQATSKNAIQAGQAFEKTGRLFKGLAAAAAAYTGFNAVKGFIDESVEAAKVQIDAETKLASVMKNTKGVTDANIQSVKNMASVLQGVGVIGDEVTIAGAQQIATFQLQAKTINKLLPGMTDLLAQQKGLNATQQDAVNVGNMMGKVMNGQVGALSRVGINFTKAQEKVLKYGTETEKAAALAEVLQMNVGGVNAALRATDQGKIQAMTNAWGDMKEVLGMAVLPAIAQYASLVEKNIPAIQMRLEKTVKKTVKTCDKAFKYVQKTYLDNPKFQKLSFTGKINFVLDDVAKMFQRWLDNGGAERVEKFGAKLGGLVGQGFISVAPTLAETAGKIAVAAFVGGLKSSPVGAAIAGALGGAAIGATAGSVVPGLGTGVGAAVGFGAGLVTNLINKLLGMTGGEQPKNSIAAGEIASRRIALQNQKSETATVPLSRLDSVLQENTINNRSLYSFSPTINIQGNADEAIVNQALGSTFKEYKQHTKEYEKQRKRLQFSPGLKAR